MAYSPPPIANPKRLNLLDLRSNLADGIDAERGLKLLLMATY